MWKIEYSKEVRNYLYDSYPYTEIIWQTIKALRQTPDGLPPENYSVIGPETYDWKVAAHRVIYKRDTERNRLSFQVVKPDEEDWL